MDVAFIAHRGYVGKGEQSKEHIYMKNNVRGTSFRSARVLIAIALASMMLAGGSAAAAGGDKKPVSVSGNSSTVSTVRNGDVVVDWSRIVLEAALTDDGFVSFMGTRHQAMMHIAMHDALNAIRPRFDQYAYFGRSKGANPIAAAAKAAHDVLVAAYPAQQATLDAELATWLATVPNGSRKTKALTLGAEAAAAIVALRQNDGTDVDLLSPTTRRAHSRVTTSSSRRTTSPSRRTSGTRRRSDSNLPSSSACPRPRR